MPRSLQRATTFADVGAEDDGQVEEGSRRRADGLGVVDVHAGAGQDDGVGAGGVGRPEHGAGVAGVADLAQHGNQPRAGVEHLLKADVQEAADGDNALRGDRVRHRGEHFVGCEVARGFPRPAAPAPGGGPGRPRWRTPHRRCRAPPRRSSSGAGPRPLGRPAGLRPGTRGALNGPGARQAVPPSSPDQLGGWRVESLAGARFRSYKNLSGYSSRFLNEAVFQLREELLCSLVGGLLGSGLLRGSLLGSLGSRSSLSLDGRSGRVGRQRVLGDLAPARRRRWRRKRPARPACGGQPRPQRPSGPGSGGCRSGRWRGMQR